MTQPRYRCKWQPNKSSLVRKRLQACMLWVGFLFLLHRNYNLRLLNQRETKKMSAHSAVGSGYHEEERQIRVQKEKNVLEPGSGDKILEQVHEDVRRGASNSSFQLPRTIQKEKQLFVGFVRIPKTGSTSMTNFLEWGSDRVRPLGAWLYPNISESDRTFSSYGPSKCFYSRLTESKLDASPQKGAFYRCGHASYRRLLRFFLHEAIPELSKEIDKVVELKMFTIVRDPFSRLVSYFRYVSGRNYGRWSHWHTRDQDACLKAQDFGCWIQALHETNRSKASFLPNQFGQLADSRQAAIDLIAPSDRELPSVILTNATTASPRLSKRPQLLVLVNECFEASVLILVDTIQPLFDADESATERSLQGSTHQWIESNIRMNQGKEQLDRNTTEHWRQKAMQWFVDDYAFYRAAVRQFQTTLMASASLDPELVKSCQEKLSKYM